MKNKDKVVISHIMSMNLDDFRDLVTDLCGESYGVGYDYGEIIFIRTDETGERIDDADEDETTEFVTNKLVEYFDLQAICSYKAVSEYGTTEVIMPFIE